MAADIAEACFKGDLDRAKQIWEDEEIDMNECGNFLFRRACRNGHLHVAKWLYTFGNINIHWNYNYLFEKSCFNGYIYMAKWLHSVGANIHTNYDMSFVYCTKRNNVCIAKWLIRSGVIPDKKHKLYNYYLAYQPIIYKLTWLHMFVKHARKVCITGKMKIMV